MQVGIAVDNTVPLHIPSFVEFIRVHAKTIHCRAINSPLRFAEAKINFKAEIARPSTTIRRDFKGNDLSLLITAIPFEDNFFYWGNGRIYIISFSDWHMLTTLPPMDWRICFAR